jgi:dTDP-N-acetylfucosamine:lipid II N-acetylfucosaminyltransferase
MNLHIMPDDKFIDEFIALVEQSSWKGQNRYIVNASQELRYVRSKVIVARYGSDEFFEAVGDVSQYDKIFIHFLTDEMCRFINCTDIKARFFWVFWGGDLYENIDYPLYDTQTYRFCLQKGIFPKKPLFQFRRHESAERKERRAAIEKVSYILHYDKSEYELIVRHFPTRAKYVFFHYPDRMQWLDLEQPLSPLELEQVKSRLNAKPGERLILLGNSGWETNNHIEIINLLATKSKFPFKVVVPLSYGNPKYIRALVEEGKRVLGDTFVPLLEFFNSSDYARILRSCDMGIFNARRTQGGGNIVGLLLAGKRAFLHPKTTFYSYLQRNGINVDSIEQIREPDDVLAKGDLDNDTQARNKERIRNLLSFETAKKAIEEVFML